MTIPTRPRSSILAAPLALGLFGCPAPDVDGGDGDGDEGDVGGEGEGEGEGELPAVTYFADVKPLIERKCLACHVDGGIAPFALDVPEDVVALAGFLASSVEAREMPPWMPGPRSPAMRDDISLTDDEIAVFSAFAAAVDAAPVDVPPLGDPADAPPPEEPEGFGLTNPDVVTTMAEPFTPTGLDTGEDEFRCFVLDMQVPVERMLIGYRFLPGNDLVDHHAILRLYPRADLAALQALDAEDPGVGWSCFGEEVPADVSRPVGSIGAWTPGNNGVALFPGTGSPVPADSVVVASMHYNVLNVIDADGTVDLARASDQSSLELYFAPVDDTDVIRTFTLPRNLNPLLRAGENPIPVDAAAHVVESTVALADMAPAARPALERAGVTRVFATGAAAHGHLLMTRIEMVAAEGTADERVLLDIPAWDFDWQGIYIYVEDIELDVETPITVRCTYDNTPARRVQVGLPADSVVVTAGEGTGDEMCIATLEIVARDPTP